MNRALAAVAAAILTAAVAYALTIPAIGGGSLAVIAGLRPDAHLLSGWLWRFISEAFGSHLELLRVCSTLVLASLIGITAFALGASRRTAGSVLWLLLLTSPLIVGVLFDPLGGENLISLGLVVFAAMDLAGLWDAKTPIVRGVIALALTLQDPTLAPVALAYSAVAGVSLGQRILPVAAVAAGVALRIYLGMPDVMREHPSLDSTAGPITIVAIGALSFGAIPVLLLLRRRIPSIVTLTGAPMMRCALLAILAILAGMFARSGDPSSYWLDAEACIIVGAMASALARKPKAGQDIATFAAALLCLQLVLLIWCVPSLPALAVSNATSTVVQAARRGDRSSPVCLVADAPARRHVLAQGGLLQLEHESATAAIVDDPIDCLAVAPAMDLTEVSDTSARDWGRGGLDLTRAAQIASTSSGVLPPGKGQVSPATRAGTPTGAGAFANVTQTPGGTIGVFTVLTGFSYRFSCVPPGTRLSFAVASADAHGGYAYEVEVVDGDRAHVIANATVLPTPRTDTIQDWHLDTLRLPSSRGCRAIVFSAPVRPGVTGAWVMFAGASVV